MKSLISTLCLAISLACASFGVGWSQDFQKGLDAYEKGDYATALKEWTPLAEEGDSDAQVNLGYMYYYGEGVMEDIVYAHMWATIASSNGDKHGKELKDWLTGLMTPSQIEKAQRLAKECIKAKKRGLNCGVEPVSVIAENVHRSKLPPCPDDTSKVFNNCYGYSDFEDGASYIGEWQNDKMHGIGTFNYPKEENGQYIGNFAENEFSGQGKLTFPDMTYEYEGNFKNDAFEGQGTLITEEGKFVGNFKDGELDGLGKHYDESGELIFEGQFAKGEPVQPHVETTPPGKDNDDGELIEGNLEAKSNPKCIPMSEVLTSLTPPDLALGILECYKVDEVQNALDMFWVMKVRAFFDAQRVNDESAGAAQGALQNELFAVIGEDFLFEIQDLLDKDKESFFNRLCSMMKTLGAPNYYPKYMILHGMNAFLGIEGDGLKPNFDADREWGKILRNDLGCKDKN